MDERYPDAMQGTAMEKSTSDLNYIRNREIVPNLKAQRDELAKRIAKIDSLLVLLEKNPDFEKLFNLTRELI